MPSSPSWAKDSADAGVPWKHYRPSLRVPPSPVVPITRSATLALFRQNRVRGLVAAIVAAALIVWPRVESRMALFSALAGLTAYVAFIGASTYWMSRKHRAGIALMSAHGIADVFLLFAVVRPLAGAIRGRVDSARRGGAPADRTRVLRGPGRPRSCSPRRSARISSSSRPAGGPSRKVRSVSCGPSAATGCSPR